MQYYYQTTNDAVVQHLTDVILDNLKLDKRVLWLISGGSNINTAVAVAHNLQDINLSNLYVSLVDERYGHIGHSDENWAQLLNAGFSLPGAHLYRPLIDQPAGTTARKFSEWLKTQFEQSDISIGLLGVGSDGHIAGVKPDSVAVASDDWAVYYSWSDYERITMTIWALSQLDQAVVYAMGDDKVATLQQLLTSDTPVREQPAQVLKQIKASILYTDYKKEAA